MKATAHKRYVTIDEKDRIQPKIDSGIQSTKPSKATSGGVDDSVKKTLEINLKDIRALGVANPLKAMNLTRNDGYLGADDMVTNAEIDQHFDSIKK